MTSSPSLRACAGASLADEAIRLRGYRRLNARVTAHYLDSRKPALGKACVTAITGRHARNALGARRDVLVAPEHNQPVIHPVDAGIGLVVRDDYARNSLVKLDADGHTDQPALSRSAALMIESSVGPRTPIVAAILYLVQPAPRASLTACCRSARSLRVPSAKAFCARASR